MHDVLELADLGAHAVVIRYVAVPFLRWWSIVALCFHRFSLFLTLPGSRGCRAEHALLG